MGAGALSGPDGGGGKFPPGGEFFGCQAHGQVICQFGVYFMLALSALRITFPLALQLRGQLLQPRPVVVVCVEFAAAQAQGFAFLAQLLDALGCGLGRHDLHL